MRSNPDSQVTKSRTRMGSNCGIRLLLAILPLLAVAIGITSVGAPALAASSPAPAGQTGGAGFNAQEDLIWAANGILALDKTPSLRVTPAQATKISAVFKRLEEKRLVYRDAKRASQPGQGQGQVQGQNAGGGQGQGGFQNMSAAEREQLRRRREQREKEIQAGVDEIDKILTPKQVEFIDNIDFDPAPYSMRPPGATGRQVGQNGFGGGMPSQQQIQELRKRSQAVRERIAKLFNDTMTYLEKRAQSKK